MSLATQVATSANQLDFFKNAGLQTSAHTDADFDKVASAFGYLPRLTHYTDASNLVKRREITVGFYLVTGKDDRTPLGEDVDVVPIAWRFKALETVPGQKPRSTTDPNSDLFKEIASRSTQTNSNCQAGIEYLIWIPSISKFATYLMGNKTALKEAAKIKPLIGCATSIKTHTYENDQHVWMGPKVLEASVPPSSLPDAGLMKETVDKFLNPPAEEAGEPAEKVEASAKPSRKR